MLFYVVTLLLLAVNTFAADQPSTAPTMDTSLKPVESNADAKVSIDAKDMSIADVIKSLSQQSKQKIVAESTVKGKVTVSISNASLETVLTSICKAGKFEWRRVYLAADSKLPEQPDRFASTVRLACGLSFPDMVVGGSLNNKVAVHSQNTAGVALAEDALVKKLGMTKVYLITNDAAMAAKEAEKNTAVNKYTETTKQLMDDFMKMTPEEREQALMASLNLMDSIGPEYMSSVMQTLMTSNPDALKRIVSRQTEYMFNMPAEQRRALIKMNMQSMTTLTPEQKQMLQEDAKAVMEEMNNQGVITAPGQ